MNCPLNIITIKWGTAFSAADVNKIYHMVARNVTVEFNFFCFTDDKTDIIPQVSCHDLLDIEVPEKHQCSPWRKLSLFSPKLGSYAQGKALFLDLDLVIVANIDSFLQIGGDEDFYIIENWTQLGKNIGNSSIYRFYIGKYDFIYNLYMQNPLAACQAHDNEQIFLSKTIIAQGLALNFWPDFWCKSFKRHLLSKNLLRNFFLAPKIPQEAKIIVFHGHPKPQEALEGKWGKKWWKSFKPATWIAEYWK